MVTCELDRDVSGEILGLKLPPWKALLLHRVLPSIGGLLVYLALICFDFALVFEHVRNGDDGLAAFCLILFSLPSLLSLVFTLATPPASLQTDLTAFSIDIEKKDIKWVAMQILNAAFFPVAAIGRYCSQIFWWVEAVYASRDEDDERTREALSEARRPSSMELYLFLQAFIHCAPHAIVNILDLMSRFSHSSFDKVSVQSVSIVISTLRMASVSTLYRRFEREKLCGKSYPWNENSKETDILITDKVLSFTEKQKEFDENIYETIMKRNSNISDSSYEKTRLNSDLIQFSPRSTIVNSTFYDHDYNSDTSSDFMPPTQKKDSSVSSGFDSDSEYVKPMTIIDKIAPRRRDTELNIEKVNVTPPPAMPAPRPGSIAVWAEKMMENAESIPTWFSAPTRRKYCDEVVQDEPDIPIRVPRSYMRGLEPQDATAAIVHYMAWYAFFVARLISICCFIKFFPFLAIILLFAQYQVMLLCLIVPQASTLKRSFYIFLAFVYLFCLMEFKVRFRHVRVWHMCWIVVCTIETVVFTGLWASSTSSGFDDWWKMYIVKVVFVSLTLSYMCLIFYFVLLKPRETIVYIKK